MDPTLRTIIHEAIVERIERENLGNCLASELDIEALADEIAERIADWEA